VWVLRPSIRQPSPPETPLLPSLSACNLQDFDAIAVAGRTAGSTEPPLSARWDDPGSFNLTGYAALRASDAELLARLRTATLDAEVGWAALVAETLLWVRGNTSLGVMPGGKRLEVYASSAGPDLSAPVFGARSHAPGSPAAAAEQAWANRLEVCACGGGDPMGCTDTLEVCAWVERGVSVGCGIWLGMRATQTAMYSRSVASGVPSPPTLQSLTRHPGMRDIVSELLFRLRGVGFDLVVGRELIVPSIPGTFGLGLRKAGNNGLLEGWQAGYGGLVSAVDAGAAPAPLLVDAALGLNASTTGCECALWDRGVPAAVS
jgi:hypothetical protein